MENKAILCLGDSLTHGYEIPIDLRWTNLLQQELGEEVINCGINGDTTAGMLARCERLLLVHKPAYLLILGGTNDLWFGLKSELIISNITAITRLAKFYGVVSIIGIPTPSFRTKERNFLKENYSQRITAFQDLLKAYCLVDNQISIDFSTEITEKHFLEDGLHPNEAGQVVLKNNALKVIKEIL